MNLDFKSLRQKTLGVQVAKLLIGITDMYTMYPIHGTLCAAETDPPTPSGEDHVGGCISRKRMMHRTSEQKS